MRLKDFENLCEQCTIKNKIEAIDECIKIVEFHATEYDGICWAIDELKEYKKKVFRNE